MASTQPILSPTASIVKPASVTATAFSLATGGRTTVGGRVGMVASVVTSIVVTAIVVGTAETKGGYLLIQYRFFHYPSFPPHYLNPSAFRMAVILPKSPCALITTDHYFT